MRRICSVQQIILLLRTENGGLMTALIQAFQSFSQLLNIGAITVAKNGIQQVRGIGISAEL